MLVAIESYKQIELVRRVVRRLATADRSDSCCISPRTCPLSIRAQPATWLRASLTSASSVHIVYRTSTDMHHHGMWRWLLRESSGNWDYFISLSGSDYPTVDGATLSQLLQRMGNVSWRLPERGAPMEWQTEAPPCPCQACAFTTMASGATRPAPT